MIDSLKDAAGPTLSEADNPMLDAEEREELSRLVQEGMDSGPGLDADLVFAALRLSIHSPEAT